MDENSAIAISDKVRNIGILADVTDDVNGPCRLHFHYALEPGPDHQVVVWDVMGHLEIQQASNVVAQQGAEWHLPSLGYAREHSCVAVAHQGTKLGSWWPEEMPQITVGDANAALTTAAMLKWVHAPIIAPGWLESVRALAWQYPAQTLASWLLDRGLPDGFTHISTQTEQWGAAVREVFSGWNPDSESAGEILDELGGVAFDEGDSDALQLLLREAPLLMGRVVKAWLESPSGLYPETVSDKRKLIDEIRLLIAGVPQHEQLTLVERNALADDGQSELRGAAAESMGVDPHYVDSVIQRVLDTLDYEGLGYRDRNNIETALNVKPFREVLGLRILSSLTR